METKLDVGVVAVAGAIIYGLYLFKGKENIFGNSENYSTKNYLTEEKVINKITEVQTTTLPEIERNLKSSSVYQSAPEVVTIKDKNTDSTLTLKKATPTEIYNATKNYNVVTARNAVLKEAELQNFNKILKNNVTKIETKKTPIKSLITNLKSRLKK